MSFLSLEFLALAAAAVVALNSLAGTPRALAFLALNGWFVTSQLGRAGALSSLAFAAAGLALVHAGGRWPRMRPWGVALVVVAFVVMRRYTFLDWIAPAGLLPRGLATAGLSFLLFKILSAAFDAWGQDARPPGVLEFANYCFNFTTFLMGPIQRLGDFRAQWSGALPLPPTFEAHLDAFNRVLRGLVKKYVLGAALHGWTLYAVADPSALAWGELGWRTVAFYVYLYLDFSGYCDVVIGVGSLMGVRPPENFNLPFLAGNVADFWLRVHRSLTTWLTDYVFNPLYVRLLRSQRLAPLGATSLALAVTMLTSGLWHGSTLSFLLFGLVHGVYLIAFRVYEHVLARRLGAKRARAWRQSAPARILGVALTFSATSLAYVFFAVDSAGVARILHRILDPWLGLP